jgi:hypothetical protein
MLFKKTLNIAANQRAAQFPGNWKIEERSGTVRNDEPKKREEIRMIRAFLPFPSLYGVYTKHAVNYSYLKNLWISPRSRDGGLCGMRCAKGDGANGRAVMDADEEANKVGRMHSGSHPVAANEARCSLVCCTPWQPNEGTTFSG